MPNTPLSSPVVVHADQDELSITLTLASGLVLHHLRPLHAQLGIPVPRYQDEPYTLRIEKAGILSLYRFNPDNQDGQNILKVLNMQDRYTPPEPVNLLPFNLNDYPRTMN